MIFSLMNEYNISLYYMTVYDGESSSEVVNLGWDSLTNINGLIQRDLINNYFIYLTWDTPNINSNDIHIKYSINYSGTIHTTSTPSYKLPIYYGNLITDEKTGIKITEEECITIETQYYINDEQIGVGETQSFCFCPPADPFCKKSKKTKIVNNANKNISTKRKYANSLKTSNGVLGMKFKNCSKASDWKLLGFTVGKNNCYKKPSFKD